MLTRLTREQILAGPKPKSTEVSVPALGGAVTVRQLTIGERDALEVENGRDGNKSYRTRLVVASTVGPDGSPLFASADVPALSALAGHVLEPIVEAAQRINRYTHEEIAELAKN